jgi:hypothetical protein
MHSSDGGRIYRARGPASDHECVDGCGRQATDWSYSHNCPDELQQVVVVVECDGRPMAKFKTYSADPTKYNPRCRPCHARLDAAFRQADDDACWYEQNA